LEKAPRPGTPPIGRPGTSKFPKFLPKSPIRGGTRAPPRGQAQKTTASQPEERFSMGSRPAYENSSFPSGPPPHCFFQLAEFFPGGPGPGGNVSLLKRTAGNWLAAAVGWETLSPRGGAVVLGRVCSRVARPPWGGFSGGGGEKRGPHLHKKNPNPGKRGRGAGRGTPGPTGETRGNDNRPGFFNSFWAGNRRGFCSKGHRALDPTQTTPGAPTFPNQHFFGRLNKMEVSKKTYWGGPV